MAKGERGRVVGPPKRGAARRRVKAKKYVDVRRVLGVGITLFRSERGTCRSSYFRTAEERRGGRALLRYRGVVGLVERVACTPILAVPLYSVILDSIRRSSPAPLSSSPVPACSRDSTARKGAERDSRSKTGGSCALTLLSITRKPIRRRFSDRGANLGLAHFLPVMRLMPSVLPMPAENTVCRRSGTEDSEREAFLRFDRLVAYARSRAFMPSRAYGGDFKRGAIN